MAVRPGLRRARLFGLWLGAPVVMAAAVAAFGALSASWADWSPGEFSLELCVVQRYGSLPQVDSGPVTSELAGLERLRARRATDAERVRREDACTEELRTRYRSSREGPLAMGLGLVVLAYLGGAALVTRRLRRRP